MKKIIAAVFCFFLGSAAFALTVDIQEISRAKAIQFENYTGRAARSDSPAAVSAIGRELAAGITRLQTGSVTYHNKYTLTHAVSKDEPEKLSADIFSIDKDSRVTHIDIIRRIISSYLESAYGYSRKNADTIAIYLSYYNALYRGDMGYFQPKYKKIVLGNLKKNDAGISTKYYDWPGRTKMLIPLTDDAKLGDPGSINPDIVADKKTTELVRKDGNLEPRKDMVEMKEKAVEKEKAKIEEKKKANEEEGKAVEQKKKDVEKKQQEIKKKETEIAKEKEEAKKIPDEADRKKKEQEIAKKEETVKKDKEETKKKEEQVKEEGKKVEQKKEETKKEEEKIAQKEKNITEEKKDIAKDELKKEIKSDPVKAAEILDKKAGELEKKEKELDKREDAIKEAAADKSVYAAKFFYLKIKEYLESGHYNNELYMINPATKKVEFKSSVTSICGNRYDVFSGGIVIITHKGGHTEGHRLTLVDRETLAAKIDGTDNIFWRSFIEIRDGFIYAIIYDSGNYYLGRFDASLKLVAKSGVKINENTFITFYEEFVYINSADKKIIVLKKSDLSLLDTIQP
jgi:hypothetical protein